MCTIIFVVMMSILPAGFANAEPVDRLRAPLAKAEVQKPRKQRRPIEPCAEYGPGFGRIEGTDTCVRIGGSVGIGVGSGSSGMTMPR